MAQRMMACLAIAALAGAVSCTDAPTTAPDTVALAVVPGTDSVTLTYICGNMFRVRNSSFEPRSVRWDIYNAAPADTGSLRARGRDVGAAYVDYYVTSRTKGTMRLFVGTTLVNTKANGNKAACAAPVDTSRFPAVDAVVRLDEAIMTLSDSSIISRTQITVKFQAGSSLAAQREFQRTFAAQYLGGAGAFRTFRIPDTIANEDSLESVTARLKQSGVVRFAAFLLILGPAKNDGARFPNDASGYRRGDYIGKNGRVWAATAMRLPQAWWCETGLYSNELTRLAVLEQNFAGDSLPDFAPSLSVVRFSEWKADTSLKNKPSQRNETAFRNHGAAVASVLTAAGDNSIGMSGVLWKSATKLYSMENTDSSRAAGAYVFVKYVLDRLIADQPRVLSLSSDFGPYRTEDLLEQNADQSLLALRRLLMALPNLTIVKSAGNDTITASTYDAAPLKKRTAMLTALLRLRDSTAFADRIVIVGATDRTNQRATFSSDLPEVDIYAPGVDIPVLRPNGAIAIESGTSFSTPLVAGVVGALVAMDPSLPASEVKQLLMEGAKDSVENSNGVNQLPQRVGGVSRVMYEADAYGSLRQLSSRAGTPICGAALVPWSNEADAASFYVTTRAIRYGTTFAEELPDFSLSAQSLAAGGRLFAGMSAQRSRLASKVWLNFEPYPDSARRLFGERDTITYFIPGNPYRAPVLQLRLLPSALSWSLNPPTAYPEFGFNFNSFGQPSLSPQGDRVVFPLERNGYSHDPYGSIAPAVRTSASLEILSGSAQTTIPLSNTAVDTRAVFASSGRSAWHPAGERFAFYAPTVIRDIGGYYLASSVRANLLLVTFGGGAPTTTEALSEQLRWPISATWSDEGERLTLIDARVDSVAITPNERLGLTDCRSRTFHANTSRQLTLIRTSPMDAHICAPTATYDEPLLDASGRAGYWCLVWSPCANGGSGGSGGGGGGGGGGMEGSIVRRREADAPARYWMRGPQRRGLPPRGARGLAFPNF